MAKILIVDDEPMVIRLLKTILMRLDHEVLTANGGEAALRVFRKHRPEVTILDLNMSDMNGIEVLKGIRAADRQVPVIVWSGAGTKALEREAQKLGVAEFLQKGVSLHELGQALKRACGARAAYQSETRGERVAI